MRIFVVVIYTESWKPIADIVLPVLHKYCATHGYGHVEMCYPEPYKSNFGYNKLRWIKDLFEYNYINAVWSLDLDTLLTNHKIRVEDFLDEQHDLFITKDVNNINAGSFIIRNTIWAQGFIDYCLEQDGKENCEQDAFVKYMNEYRDEKICLLPHPSINSYDYTLYPEHNVTSREEGHWHHGDFLLHLPGISMMERLNVLSNTPVIL